MQAQITGKVGPQGQGRESPGLLRLSLSRSLFVTKTSQPEDFSLHTACDACHLSVADFLYLLTLPEASALITMADK